MKRAPDGIHLLQSHVVKRMIQSVNLFFTQDDKGHNVKDTPAVKPLPTRDTSGAPRSLPWNFMSVIGMLNCLSGSTRPDMYFVVHQVARFCAQPKRSHKKSAITIARHLQTSIRFGTFYKIEK